VGVGGAVSKGIENRQAKEGGEERNDDGERRNHYGK
jgi:hypothetical protein